MKNIFSVILALLMTISSIARAEESVVFPIKEGAQSPISGLLLSQKAVADIIADKKLEPERTSIQVEKAVSTVSADCNLRLDNEKNSCSSKIILSETQVKLRDNQINQLDRQLLAAKKENERLPYYFLGGLVAGTALTILTTIVAVKVSN